MPEAPATAVKATMASRQRLIFARRASCWSGEEFLLLQGLTDTSAYFVKSMGKLFESMISFDVRLEVLAAYAGKEELEGTENNIDSLLTSVVASLPFLLM